MLQIGLQKNSDRVFIPDDVIIITITLITTIIIIITLWLLFIYFWARESGVTGLSAACLSTKRCRPQLEGVSWGQTSSARLSGVFCLSVTQCDARDSHSTGTRLCCIPTDVSCRAFYFIFPQAGKSARAKRLKPKERAALFLFQWRVVVVLFFLNLNNKQSSGLAYLSDYKIERKVFPAEAHVWLTLWFW